MWKIINWKKIIILKLYMKVEKTITKFGDIEIKKANISPT